MNLDGSLITIECYYESSKCLVHKWCTIDRVRFRVVPPSQISAYSGWVCWGCFSWFVVDSFDESVTPGWRFVPVYDNMDLRLENTQLWQYDLFLIDEVFIEWNFTDQYLRLCMSIDKVLRRLWTSSHKNKPYCHTHFMKRSITFYGRHCKLYRLRKLKFP